MAEIVNRPKKPRGDNKPGPIKAHNQYIHEYGKCVCGKVPPTSKRSVYGATYCSRDIIHFVKFRTGYKMDVIADVYNEIFHFLGQQIANGKQVTLPGFGSWYTVTRPPRECMGGIRIEKIKLPKRKLMRFSLSEYLLPIWKRAKFDTDTIDYTVDWPTLFANTRAQRKHGHHIYKQLVQRKKK